MPKVGHAVGMPMRAIIHSKFFLLLVSFFVILLFQQTQIQDLKASLHKIENTLDPLSFRKLRNAASTSSPMGLHSQQYNDPQNLLVIYNRIPKTGSTSLTGIAYDLCKDNRFHVLNINTTKNSHTMSVQDQMRYVKNITAWTARKPAFYHGHVAYIDFSSFGSIQKPLYINIIRRPMERLVSYYYFLRYGDDFRPSLVRHRNSNKETFNDCVVKERYDCAPERLWIQVPFFCGHAEECWKPGSRWALEQAKYNMVNNYVLVGVTDELEEFVAILEATLPSMFRGALSRFQTGKKSHLRKTTKKEEPSEATFEYFKKNPIWQAEEEFYNFVLENFQTVKRRSLLDDSGQITALEQQWRYKKVRPR